MLVHSKIPEGPLVSRRKSYWFELCEALWNNGLEVVIAPGVKLKLKGKIYDSSSTVRRHGITKCTCPSLRELNLSRR